MFRVRPESGEPIYLQLVRQVKHAVATSVLRPDDQLPTVRALAAELLINPNTVSRAYRELESEGIIETMVGRGSFVRAPGIGLAADERRRRLQPFVDQLFAEGHTLGYEPEEVRSLVDEHADRVRNRSSSDSVVAAEEEASL